MDKPQKQHLLDDEETENTSRPITSKEIKSVIKSPVGWQTVPNT